MRCYPLDNSAYYILAFESKNLLYCCNINPLSTSVKAIRQAPLRASAWVCLLFGALCTWL
jgi:hypothetical protein